MVLGELGHRIAIALQPAERAIKQEPERVTIQCRNMGEQIVPCLQVVHLKLKVKTKQFWKQLTRHVLLSHAQVSTIIKKMTHKDAVNHSSFIYIYIYIYVYAHMYARICRYARA